MWEAFVLCTYNKLVLKLLSLIEMVKTILLRDNVGQKQ